MSKDNQIEGMTEDIYSIFRIDTMSRAIASMLYDDGYCKASDVASEIFEKIEEMLNLQVKIVCEARAHYKETAKPMLSFIAMLDGRIYSLRVIEEHIAELKKKYTESEDTE